MVRLFLGSTARWQFVKGGREPGRMARRAGGREEGTVDGPAGGL